MADRMIQRPSGGISLGPLDLTSISDPSAPAASHGRMFVRSRAGGKLQLAVQFPNGDIQAVFSEPLDRQIVTLGTNEKTPHGFIYVASLGKLFASTLNVAADGNARIIRFNNLLDLTDRTSITVASESYHDIIYSTSKGKLYVSACLGNTHLRIREIDPTTLATTLVVDATLSGIISIANESLCTDETYLYFPSVTLKSDFSIECRVYKYALSDWSLIGYTVLTGGIIGAHCARFDGSKIYITSAAYVVRINPNGSGLPIQEEILTVSGAIFTDDMAITSTHLFLGNEVTTGTNLLRVNKTALSTYETITTDIRQSCFAAYYDGEYIWAVFNTSPGTLIRLDPVGLSQCHYIFATGNGTNEVVSDGQRLYLTTFGDDPAKVIRITKPTFGGS